MAWSPPTFLGAGTMLMGADDGAVDHRVFVVGIRGEMFEDPLPDAGLRPATEAAMRVVPVSETCWQIPPGNAGSVTINDGLNEQSIVSRGDAY
jgi:hypothetical protein